MTPAESEEVWIDYMNHRGVRRWYRVLPIDGGLRFDASQWHPERQWVMAAYDVDRDLARTFALKDIHAWRTTPPPMEVKPEVYR